jgi:internalin A
MGDRNAEANSRQSSELIVRELGRRWESLEPLIRDQLERALVDQAQHLDLGWSLSELPDLSSFKELRSLDLSGATPLVLTRGWSFLPPKLQRLAIPGRPLTVLPQVPELILDWSQVNVLRSQLREEQVVGIHFMSGLADLPEHVPTGFPNLQTVEFTRNWGGRYAGSPTLRDVNKASRILRAWKTIRSLVFFNCGLREVPDLSQLASSLQELTIAAGAIRELPSAVWGDLKQLRALKVNDVGLKSLPAWVFEIDSLEELDFSCNLIEELPTNVRPGSSMASISVRNNRISKLPSWLGSFERLLALDISDNCLESFAEPIWRLSKLTNLSLSRTLDGATFAWARGGVPILHCHTASSEVTSIPPEILQLENLRQMDISGQPIATPPLEIALQGAEAVKSYWRQRESQGVDYLCEAKLIIVGEAGAGKTTLAHKLLDPSRALDAMEKSTEGIEIRRWTFPTTVHPRQEGAPSVDREFAVSIWDFGGQEIYHATHQFFLTRRSAYVLVADSRKEDTDFNYWMRVVDLLSDGSPLLIVTNEKQDRRRDLDEQRLRARFRSLVDIVAVNLATNRGVEEVRRRIRGLLQQLPHVGDVLPASWRRVRKRLEWDVRDTISQDELLKVCGESGFDRREDALHLAGYLHDLGVCLHFQDDPVLKHLVILRPEWGTDAVYRVLDDPNVVAKGGRIEPTDIGRIWGDSDHLRLRDELLQLMRRFELCHPLGDTGDWIAPQLLSQTKPQYSLGSGPERVLFYEYAFMPKGILTRFVVANHELAAEQDKLTWRWGVVLEHRDSRCEVIEDYGARRMTLRARGDDAKLLMAIAHRELERIHSSYHERLEYRVLVPCRCRACRITVQAGTFTLDDLNRATAHGERLQCRVSFEMVEPQALLEDAMEQKAAVASPLKQVFLSYAHRGDVSWVARLQSALEARGIVLVRDKDSLEYKDSVSEFMAQLCNGKAVVVAIGDEYLRSKFCMYELVRVARASDFRDRVFPLLLDGVVLSEPLERLDVIEYWEKKIASLDERLKRVEGAHLASIQEELSRYREIRAFMDRIIAEVADMNWRGCLELEELASSVAERVAT